MDAGKPRTIVARVVARAGGPSVLARHFGIKPQSVTDWLEADRIPPTRVLECERLSGVPRWRIRPDIYPRPSSEPAHPAEQ
jgi:DNA-binding transcriptional regulator YdaS (Cro superfamily)